MANLTLAIDDKLLEKARMQAFKSHTTVNALVRLYLEELTAGEGRQRRALKTFVELAKRTGRRSGRREKRSWTRDDLHAR